MYKNHFGVTLLELLVTITILSIVSTLATIYFTNNISQSRDGKRLADIENIEKNLDIFFTKRGQYPIPDGAIDITYSGSTVWTQGEFGEKVNTNLGVFGREYPMDPYYDVNYTYSVANNNREYQIAGILENIPEAEGLGGGVSQILIPQAISAGGNNAIVNGNYNGFMVRAFTGGLHYFIAAPSIVTYDISDTDLQSILDNEKFVFDTFLNLPHTYKNKIGDLDGGFSFVVADPVLFSDTDIKNIKTESGILEFMENIKFAYSALPIGALDTYQNMTQENGIKRLKTILLKYYNISFGS